MKLHRPIVYAIVDILTSIFIDNKYADKSIERAFKANRKWGSRDRKLIAESVYSIIRWFRYYKVLAGLQNLEKTTQQEIWLIVAVHLLVKKIGLPDMEEFAGLSEKIDLSKKNLSRAEKQSIPDWMDELCQESISDWPQVLSSLNQQAKVFLRVNTLKTNQEKLIESLHREDVDVEPVEGFDDALVLKQRKNVFATKSFQKGFFEVQDCGSQKIAPFLNVKPGMRVIDACAGAGGKSLHLASLMANKGKLIALDIHDWKLKELRKRASRNSVDIIETRAIDSSKVIKRLKNTADALLLDVPCTGLGVLKRNPDTKWKLDKERLEELESLQSQILNDYSAMLKVGGTLVYATCSVLPRENSFQVKKMLEQKAGEWELEEELILLPHEYPGDGFYAARLKRLK